MTRPEFFAVVEPLVLAMRAELDMPTRTAYYRVLQGVPVALLEGAVDRLMREGGSFFPKAPELLAACEKQRREALALVPYTGCDECAGRSQKGWRSILGADGYERLERCPCRIRYQQRLDDYGLSEALAQLPGEAEPQAESYHPTAEQLPEALRKQMLDIVRQKVLR